MQTTTRLLAAGLLSATLCTTAMDWENFVPTASTAHAERGAEGTEDGGTPSKVRPKVVQKIVAGDDSPGAATQAECRAYNDTIVGLKEAELNPSRFQKLRTVANGILEAAYARGCDYEPCRY